MGTRSNSPTHSLTNAPTSLPTNQQSANPTLESLISSAPTNTPTSEPTNNPATTQPTPAIPLTATPTSVQPTYLPTDNPTVTPDSQATYSSSSGPWGQSKLDIIPDNIIGSSNGLNYKCVETNFEGAVETCAANNARLCTPKEISDRCTRGTGCNFNSRLVWTCIAGEDACASDAECCSGTCGADGTCA